MNPILKTLAPYGFTEDRTGTVSRPPDDGGRGRVEVRVAGTVYPAQNTNSRVSLYRTGLGVSHVESEHDSVRSLAASLRRQSARVGVSFDGPSGDVIVRRAGMYGRYSVTTGDATHDRGFDVLKPMNRTDRARVLDAIRDTASDGKARTVKVSSL